MRVTASITIEFDPSDNCGQSRQVSAEYNGDWDAVPLALGQALAMLNAPRETLIVARLVQELGIEPSMTLSGQLADVADKIVEAFNRVDAMKSAGADVQDIVGEMAVI